LDGAVFVFLLRREEQVDVTNHGPCAKRFNVMNRMLAKVELETLLPFLGYELDDGCQLTEIAGDLGVYNRP
jgi:hypothetical protein